MKKIPMAKLTGDYVGKPFDQCPCLPLLHSLYTDLEIPVPDEFEGFDLTNYLPFWESDKKEAIETLFRLFESLGDPVADLDRLEKFDLLAVQEEGNIFVAMYLGQDQAITSSVNVGVRLFFLGDLYQVIMARRLTPCPR